MALGITLSLAAFIGIFYGMKKKNKTLVAASVILLIFIVIIGVVYSYLYAKNPY